MVLGAFRNFVCSNDVKIVFDKILFNTSWFNKVLSNFTPFLNLFSFQFFDKKNRQETVFSLLNSLML